MRYMEDVYSTCGNSFDTRACELLSKAVLRPFGYLRGYHGCRPVSFESYRCDGLLVLTRERLAKMAFELFEGSIPFVTDNPQLL